MTVTILIGAQWGDEGKGRVADWLAAESDVVARYAGGDNAGHTVYVGEDVYKLHLIPSGILHERVTCVLGNGMVINPVNLMREMEQLRAMGVDLSPERLAISTRAHIITPAHIAQDKASEAARGENKIGTTLRGIGPTYLDKTGRRGIRMGAMNDIEDFADKVKEIVEQAKVTLAQQGLAAELDGDAAAKKYIEAAVYLKPYLRDTSRYVNERLAEGARVLCEGAQGTMLDIDHGDYPYVTSSSPTSGGALIGLGIGPRHVERVVGVAKAFSTRVGEGPMPTELDDAIADKLRGTGDNFWDEFGTTTGRPRRCGWLDVVMLRYAAQVNGFTEMVITKLDILSGFDEIKLAVAYEIDGERHDYLPDSLDLQRRARPIYETVPGWQEDISGARGWGDLPAAAQHYVTIIGEQVALPVRTISVGPEREQLVHT
jgi:adenylosuccinate synthase